MQVSGMLHCARRLQFVGFLATGVLGPDASEEEIRALIDKHRMVFITPVFKGGVCKKGKAGLIGKATDLKIHAVNIFGHVSITMRQMK